MAYQFADGFDNYGNNYTMTAGYPWDTIQGTNATTTADTRFVAPGTLPGASLSISTNSTAWVRKNLTGTPATVIVGFGFKVSNLTGNCDIVSLWDTSTLQVVLALNSNGALQFYRNGVAGTAIGTLTGSGTIVANAWYGIVIQVTIDPAAGAVSAYLNGNPVAIINSTGLNTRQTANSQVTQVAIGSVQNGGANTIKYDDFYCFDTTGPNQNALLGGDARILTKMPSGAGNYTNWTPTGLGSNWQNVSQQPPNIADYNANNVATTKDAYAMQVASMGVAPYFVMARASLERDDAGTHNPSLFVRSGATDSGGVVTPTLTSSYLFYDALFQTDPSTTVAWTASGADNAQVGIIEG